MAAVGNEARIRARRSNENAGSPVGIFAGFAASQRRASSGRSEISAALASAQSECQANSGERLHQSLRSETSEFVREY